VENAKATGYYVAGVYREKASGARADRPELLRMIGDLQPATRRGGRGGEDRPDQPFAVARS
jgi:DNA invertase Pin-like site-specific DNA recombinase